MNKLNAASCLQDSSSSHEPPYRKPPEPGFLVLLALAFTIVVGYAVFQGEPVTADVTPTHVHLEVGGRFK